MPKERNFNPVQEQRKADKAKALKKGKAEVVARRNEKLARRNPDRIQKQIDDLKKIASGGGKLSKHEESVLEGLERELKSVNKAREALGDKAPTFGRPSGGGGLRHDGHGGGPPGALGKRRRDGGNNSSDDDDDDDDDVPEDVKSIPMPRDTPPPIPKQVLDEWYAKRRAKRTANEAKPDQSQQKPPAAPVESKTVYEAKPAVRDLRKEAASAFVPAVVREKMDKSKGQGGLIEPEEADRLEQEGYMRTTQGSSHHHSGGPQPVALEEVDDDEDV